MKIIFTVSVLALMCAGCGDSRVSQDMITYDSLTKNDQAFITNQRTRESTGGIVTHRKTPRWVYVDGVLVDTNNAQWVWQEGSPKPMTEKKEK